MTEHDQKQLFAKLLLKLNNPFNAALEIFPEDVSTALQVSHEWPKDPVVISIRNGICDNVDEMDLLPTKAETCKALLAEAKSMRGTDQYSKIMKLYLDTMGFIEKPTTQVNIDNKIQSNVMVLKDNGNDDEWEAKLKKQQEKLADVSSG